MKYMLLVVTSVLGGEDHGTTLSVSTSIVESEQHCEAAMLIINNEKFDGNSVGAYCYALGDSN